MCAINENGLKATGGGRMLDCVRKIDYRTSGFSNSRSIDDPVFSSRTIITVSQFLIIQMVISACDSIWNIPAFFAERHAGVSATRQITFRKKT